MKKINLTILATLLMTGLATQASSEITLENLLSSTSADSIREIVRDEIRNNPELIIETLNAYQAKQQEASMEDRIKADSAKIVELHSDIFEYENTPKFGADSNEQVAVEFFDYNCSYCRKVAADFKESAEENKTSIIFKNLPVISNNSIETASVAQAVMMYHSDKFLDFHNTLIASEGEVTMQTAMDVAVSLGISKDDLDQQRSSNEVQSAILHSVELAEKLQISGTPAFVMGGYLLRGAPPRQVIDAVLKGEFIPN